MAIRGRCQTERDCQSTVCAMLYCVTKLCKWFICTISRDQNNCTYVASIVSNRQAWSNFLITTALQKLRDMLHWIILKQTNHIVVLHSSGWQCSGMGKLKLDYRLSNSCTGVELFIGSKQRFRVWYVLKFALQRMGEKRVGVQISKQSTQNPWPKNLLQPCKPINKSRLTQTQLTYSHPRSASH